MTKDICPELVPYVNIYLLMLTVSTFVMLLALLKKKSSAILFACPYCHVGPPLSAPVPSAGRASTTKKSVDS